MEGYFMAATHTNHRSERVRRARDQRPLRLLSLDGGGVRGFSQLLLIENLMLNLFVEMEGRAPLPEELPRPCDHFDLIGGTGTGGLMGILLGRLRLDVETTKKVWVQVSKKVFESDKTLGGLPFKKTLFKASLLEEVIRDVVREYAVPAERDSDSCTIHSNSNSAPYSPMSPMMSPVMMPVSAFSPANSLRSPGGYGSSSGASSHSNSSTLGKPDRAGDGDALLLDSRPDRCKTFLTATYKDSDESTPPAFLRTYESSHSAAPSPRCTIWQAGRATSAHFPAFKPMQIGHDIFIDDGPGRYSPVAHVLEEAMVHEFPGREVGILVSIGSGKLPADVPAAARRVRRKESHGLLQGTRLGKFVDAKAKHMAKLQDCESIHLELLDSLERAGVSRERYFRFNVEVGVGDFGINEWSRLAEISTSTRKFLSKPDVHAMNRAAGEIMASIYQSPAYGSSRRSVSTLNSISTHSTSSFPMPPRSSKGSMANSQRFFMSRELPSLPQETDEEEEHYRMDSRQGYWSSSDNEDSRSMARRVSNRSRGYM